LGFVEGKGPEFKTDSRPLTKVQGLKFILVPKTPRWQALPINYGRYGCTDQKIWPTD
jgi:hypothetical protein